MDYKIQWATDRNLGRVEKVFVGARCVGMVYRDPNPPEEFGERWMAYDRVGHGVESREAGIRDILRHASAQPDFELQ